MVSHITSKIFVIGGTGAQGIPVIKSLVADKRYSVLALTRDTTSSRAKSLLGFGNVELLEGSLADEAVLLAGYKRCDGAFINIDGFNTGEKAEIYYAIRAYELALQAGTVKFFVYGNLDYGFKKSGYDPKFRAGHYDGKGRVGEWILQQNKDNSRRMGAALFTTGPYIEMAIAKGTLMSPTVEDGILTWRVPLGTGSVNHVSLEDCGFYVRWLFDNPSRSNGIDLEVAIAPIKYDELASAFTRVTGKPARFIDTSLEDYWTQGPLSRARNMPAGYNAGKDSMKIEENFTGFWHVWAEDLLKRDYNLLDEIHPGRIKSAEEFFRREEERGGKGSLWERVQGERLAPILKISEDGRKGKL
ncbi:hypothetical protein B0O99DRAFT_722601 [Bisporella sp. PMI_857]|nr:hypothetical protein B0O99DRAFT_722601 [Bisporella sp. PMI_857]